MPDSLAVPRAVVARAAHVPPWELPQATILTYRWNDHHRLHLDHTAYGAIIACLSLGGAATLAIEDEEASVHFHIEPRSVYILRGTARWRRHALTAHRQRTSITFRTISGA
jgi:alkylated DNA repair dioxygenase AlkB